MKRNYVINLEIIQQQLSKMKVFIYGNGFLEHIPGMSIVWLDDNRERSDEKRTGVLENKNPEEIR